MRIFRRVVGALIFLCVLPYFISLSGSILAVLVGCRADLAAIDTCVIAGHDISGLLEVLITPAIALYFTLPVMLLLLLAWPIVELIHWLWPRRPAA